LYALSDPEKPRVLDPAIQTSPTVIVLIALAYRIISPGVWLARMVVLPFAVLACVVFILLARRLIGDGGASLAFLFLLAGTYDICQFCADGTPGIGRSSCARLSADWSSDLVPLAGTQNACSGRLDIQWDCLGHCYGNQIAGAHFVPVALGIILALDRLYYRKASWPAVIVPGVCATACVAGWYAAQIAIVGSDQFYDNASVLRDRFWLHIAALDPERRRNALSVLWRTGRWLLGVLAIVWGVYQARQPTSHGFVHAVLPVFLGVNLVWFAALSIG
jgi:hypothetical protein